MGRGRLDLDQLCAELDASDFQPEDHSTDWKPYSATLAEIRFHAENRYWQFTPTYTDRFEDRLQDWVGNHGLTRAQRAILLNLVPELQFVDRDDLLSLYRSAFLGPIVRWLADRTMTTFSHAAAVRHQRIRNAIKETWFCSITDSMDIGQFLHINNIQGADQRPPWRILRTFGSQAKIRAYCKSHKYRRVVILEDFVGSGTQAVGPLKFATKQLGPSIQVLFVPLIASAPGLERLERDTKRLSTLKIEPVFVIPREAQILAIPLDNDSDREDKAKRQLRRLVLGTFDKVKAPAAPETTPLKEPFGFGDLGMLLVLYTNCPNNSLPLLWHSNDNWRALFSRISRR